MNTGKNTSSGRQSSDKIKSLCELGFSENEARVYLALLELGRGTVSLITRRAGINRTTGYDILASLVTKQLASVTGKEPKQEYSAESPARLEVLLREEVSRTQARLAETAANLIPQLKSMQTTVGRPNVRFYEGKEGLIQAYEDTLTAREPIRAYANIEDMHAALPGYFPRYYARRAARGIIARGILSRSPAAEDRARYNAAELRETALIPYDKFHFSPEINIYDNKVMIASSREQLGIIIESDEIADAMKKIFELSWAEAKRLDQATRVSDRSGLDQNETPKTPSSSVHRTHSAPTPEFSDTPLT